MNLRGILNMFSSKRSPAGAEPRTFPGAEVRVGPATLRVERREGNGGKADVHIVGHAAMYDQWTTLYSGEYYEWREVIRPGAFKRAIAEKQDVRSLFNHSPDWLLGRTKSGTLTLAEDGKGLLSDTTPPDTQTVRDMVLTPIDRGDLDGMSFAFVPHPSGDRTRVDKEDGSVVIEDKGERVTYHREGDRIIEERELLDVDLYDVSPVTYPAYDGTDVGLRALGPDIRARAERMDVPPDRRAEPAPKVPTPQPAPADPMPALLEGLHTFEQFRF